MSFYLIILHDVDKTVTFPMHDTFNIFFNDFIFNEKIRSHQNISSIEIKLKKFFYKYKKIRQWEY